eukprot:6873010-Pyramimonas_sp.AAC.1
MTDAWSLGAMCCFAYRSSFLLMLMGWVGSLRIFMICTRQRSFANVGALHRPPSMMLPGKS